MKHGLRLEAKEDTEDPCSPLARFGNFVRIDSTGIRETGSGKYMLRLE